MGLKPRPKSLESFFLEDTDMISISGSIVALATPFHDDGSVDYAALRKLIDWHIAEGTDCICVVGTTGESPTVNVDEHCEIIRVAVEQAKGRRPIMAGCGANSTAEAIELAHNVIVDNGEAPAANQEVQDGQRGGVPKRWEVRIRDSANVWRVVASGTNTSVTAPLLVTFPAVSTTTVQWRPLDALDGEAWASAARMPSIWLGVIRPA